MSHFVDEEALDVDIVVGLTETLVAETGLSECELIVIGPDRPLRGQDR